MFASIGFSGIATSRVAVSIRLTLKHFTLKMAYVFSCDLRTLRTPTRPIVMAQFRNIGSFGFVLLFLCRWYFGYLVFPKIQHTELVLLSTKKKGERRTTVRPTLFFFIHKRINKKRKFQEKKDTQFRAPLIVYSSIYGMNNDSQMWISPS